MKTNILTIAAAAIALSGCETAPHHNVSVNQICLAGEPAHAAVARIAPPYEVGKVKIDTDDWAHYQHLLDQERREKIRNNRFAHEHIRGW